MAVLKTTETQAGLRPFPPHSPTDINADRTWETAVSKSSVLPFAQAVANAAASIAASNWGSTSSIF